MDIQHMNSFIILAPVFLQHNAIYAISRLFLYILYPKIHHIPLKLDYTTMKNISNRGYSIPHRYISPLSMFQNVSVTMYQHGVTYEVKCGAVVI